MSRRQLLKYIWAQRCAGENNYVLSAWDRFWLSVKATICVLLNLPDIVGHEDWVVVAAWDGHYYLSFDCFNAYEWTQLTVALNGWRYSVYNDGNC